MSKKIINNNESGMVSLLVVMTIMFILSLLVINFARLVRREERQVLDYSLNSQAFYAAESGINDAVDAIKNNPGLLSTDYKTTCNGFIAAAGLNNVVDAAANVSYPCLFVSSSPTQLNFTGIGASSSKLFPVSTKDGTAISQIMFSWEAPVATHNVDDCPDDINGGRQNEPTWPTTPSNCTEGVIRVDIVPASATSANIESRTYTAFFYPDRSGELVTDFSEGVGSGQGHAMLGECDGTPGPKFCNVTVQGLGATDSTFYVRVRALYRSANLIVCSPSCVAPKALTGAQAIIDATGKANDVLKRVQAYVPITSSPLLPEFGLQATDGICKRYMFSSPELPLIDNPDNNGACLIQ